MSEKYTRGPWKTEGEGIHAIIRGGDATIVAVRHRLPADVHEANARRIVACVNACEGISTDELEEIASTGGMLGPREDVARIAKQRDELLAALKDLVCYDSYSTEYDGRIYDICPSCGAQDGEHKAHCEFLFARAAIAKATGEQS